MEKQRISIFFCLMTVILLINGIVASTLTNLDFSPIKIDKTEKKISQKSENSLLIFNEIEEDENEEDDENLLLNKFDDKKFVAINTSVFFNLGSSNFSYNSKELVYFENKLYTNKSPIWLSTSQILI